MAKPRVFISSTFFDLRTFRDDLDRFVKSQGFEPVRHERGQISYGADERPEHYAYREIDTCDMLICIIGGRFGTQASSGSYSITQQELKTALEKGKQVYIFVEDSVNHEHRYFLLNRAVDGVKFPAVDNIKVHEFLEEIQALSKGNPTFSFSVASDITALLQEQWAGLFQRLLQENANRQQASLIEELQRSLQTVGQLVKFLSDQNDSSKAAIDEILFENHPLFLELREALGVRYRIYFRSIEEIDTWLKSIRGYVRSESNDRGDFENSFEWVRIVKVKEREFENKLLLAKTLFSQDGRLRPMQATEWADGLLQYTSRELKAKKATGFSSMDDDIPF